MGSTNDANVLDTVLADLHTNRESILEELIAFASIPSVSTDPEQASAVARAAKWVAFTLAAAGDFNPRIIETPRNPIVYGEWLGTPGALTVLVYGHYDVQPVDPLEKWHNDPFHPTTRDGRLYARGVSDDKGPMLIPLAVAKAFYSLTSKLPINVKFMFEGEEEIGSPSLEAFIRDNQEMLAADFVISADGAMWRIDEPSLTVASRGLAGLEFTLTAAKKDLHSGRHGGSVANPLHAMAEIIRTLHDAKGRVSVAGFYDRVEELTSEERLAIAQLPFEESAYLDQIGAPAPFGEAGYTTLERQWTRPTLELNGMWGGYQGPGSKTVIPSEAHAKITCRLVPHQDPEEIVALVTKHLESHVPSGTHITITPGDHGSRAAHIPTDHFALKAAAEALHAVYGVKPLVVRMGGTVPISELFQRLMGLETVFFSFSTADEDYHAPNEFFRVHRLHEGLEAWARYWDILGRITPPPQTESDSASR
jgi:acetylornithine deacetylase/succinyl-diaminopimelate desuccinylase-like protein